MFKQADRRPIDGPVSVSLASDDCLFVSVDTDGRQESITMSEYNAARVFAGLALFLKIPLSKTVQKAIKL